MLVDVVLALIVPLSSEPAMAAMLVSCILLPDVFSLDDFLESLPPELGSMVRPGSGAILSFCS